MLILNQGRRNLLTGKAGECAVASQLFLRDCAVMFAIVDLGADLMAENGCRIQVKTAHVNTTEKSIQVYGQGAYIFPLPRARRRPITNSTSRMLPKAPFTEICDVVVFWGIEENRFWVVPASICDLVQAFVLGPTGRHHFVDNIEGMRDMVKLGYTHDEVATKYDCSRAKVTRLVNSDKESQEPSAVSFARNHENAWELITDFSRTAAIEQIQPDSIPVQE